MRTLFGYLSLIFGGLKAIREGQREIIEQQKRIIELLGEDPLPNDDQAKVDELAARLKSSTDMLAERIAANQPTT